MNMILEDLMTTRVVDLMMMMIRWSWWIQGGVDLDDLPDDDHWQEGGLTCQQAAWEGSSGCVPAQHTGANTSKHWRCRYRTIHTNTELGVNTTPTDEHYQHKSNTMVSEYYIYQDRPFLMHKTTRMPESKAIDHLNHTHVLLSNTNNRECFDPSDSQYKRRTKQYNVACCHRLWPHLPRETTGIPAHWLSFISAVQIFMGNYNSDIF